MSPRLKRILIGVVAGSGVIVLAIWVLTHTLGEHETLFQGKPLDFWCSQLTNQQSAVSNQARLVLDQVALPQLIEAMYTDTNDSKIRLLLIEQLNNLPGVTIYFTPADGRRAEAAQYLGELGPGAKAAIPSLIKALKGSDQTIRGPAAIALGKIQCQPETIIPLLIASIDDPQDDVQEAAIDALGEFGPLSKAAVPKIVPFLKAPDKDLRHAATVALKKIQPQAADHP